MKLTVLGSGDAISGSGHNAAYLIDSHVLIDGGAPIPLIFRQHKMSLYDIDTLLITHFHADHTYMIPTLLASLAYLPPPSSGHSPLTIAGPVGTREYLERLILTGHGVNVLDQIAKYLSPSYCILADGDDRVINGLRVKSHAVVHSVGPSLAYAISTDQSPMSLGFTGDTEVCGGLLRLIESVDFLVCECTTWGKTALPGHLCSSDISKLMTRYPCTQFLLTHMSEHRFLPNALIAHDMLTLNLFNDSPVPIPAHGILPSKKERRSRGH